MAVSRVHRLAIQHRRILPVRTSRVDHTLKVADDAPETDVFFIIEGAMLILDAQENVVAIFDVASTLRDYPKHLRVRGRSVPDILVDGFTNYTQ
ncbi:hypothetical protein JWS13_12755 [Rhodococcus pseudokoreensis]|uniref:Cyclic nucleotide-binding domain-containing protein n=1 Tax=Rhodococcus pseudokoreensis TaxID=2811421 RepID=A0A974W1A2_9NOCA|nr:MULTISPECIES: hypothetical protein [Rhodococcus]QSE89429.1 hypothetical protein JWS13_12755 [Rhodococcus pseudokoreensis]